MPSTVHDSVLWYSVGAWADFGLGVPNWSNDTHSQNESILEFIRTTGRNLQAIMWHDDARLSTPPTIRTLRRVHSLCVRARTLLASRAIPENQLKMEPLHANPTPEVHRVYPVPFFLVRNSWLRSWCSYILMALTDAMQHQENASALDFSVVFAADVGQYIHRVYQRMATELFNVAVDEAKKLDFTLTEAQLNAYAPSEFFTRTEMIDTIPELWLEQTEDSLKVLTDGIPVTHIPNLGRWPADVGVPLPSTAEATGGDTNQGTTSFVPQPKA